MVRWSRGALISSCELSSRIRRPELFEHPSNGAGGDVGSKRQQGHQSRAVKVELQCREHGQDDSHRYEHEQDALDDQQKDEGQGARLTRPLGLG